MDDKNNRKHVRTRLRAAVKLSHPAMGDFTLHTRDISDSGAYIFCEPDKRPAIGELVDVQVQGLPGGDAPIVKMRVVRLDDAGMGLEFVDD